jgi:hypothetical protein
VICDWQAQVPSIIHLAMKLGPAEIQLVGKWEFVNGRVRGDATCQRIEWLTTCYLEKIALGNWETLFKDPGDGCYWEKKYPQGPIHGGGPPVLVALTAERAHAKYGFSDILKIRKGQGHLLSLIGSS